MTDGSAGAGATPSGVAAQRLGGLDAAKALAAVAVVMIHAAPSQVAVYMDYVAGGAARLAVPLFILVSGYLAGLFAAPAEKMRGNFFRFLRLHLVWALFYWGVFELWGIAPETYDWKWIVGRFGEAGYAGQYYFVVVLQIYAFCAVFPFIGVAGRPWEKRSVALAASLFSIAPLFFFPEGVESGKLIGESVLATFAGLTRVGVWHWFFYFALGATLGSRDRDGVDRTHLPVAMLLVAGGIAVAAIGWPLVPSIEARNAMPYTRLTIVLGGAALGFALPLIARMNVPGAVRVLGQNSFGVFVLNPLLVHSLTMWIGLPVSALDSLARVAVVVVASVGLSRILLRWVPWAMP